MVFHTPQDVYLATKYQIVVPPCYSIVSLVLTIVPNVYKKILVRLYTFLIGWQFSRCTTVW